VLLALAIMGVAILLYNQAHAHHHHAEATTGIGGTLLVTSEIINVTTNDLAQLNALLTAFAACAPPPSDPIYNTLVLGTVEDTTASWQAFMDYDQATCDFYGLIDVQVKTAALLGPANLCHAYFTVGLQIVQTYYGGVLPPFIYQMLIALAPRVFPLNMYWNTAALTYSSVASAALHQLNTYIISSNKQPSTYAKAFCNGYFAQNTPEYYTSVFQPWLAFPFELLVDRRTNTYIPNNLQDIIQQVRNLTAADTDPLIAGANASVPYIKSIYAIGTGYSANPSAQLYVQSVIQNMPVVELPVEWTVAEALAYVQASITVGGGSTGLAPTINASDVPVLVIARYADNPGAYNGYKVPAGTSSIFFLFTDDNVPGSSSSSSGGLDTNLTSLAQQITSFASSPGSVGVIDVLEATQLAPLYGSIYAREKDVADIIQKTMVSTLSTSNTQSFSLLDTFAIKNTLVNGVDVGGRLTQQQLLEALQQSGQASFGIKVQAFTMELQEAIVQSPKDTAFFGASATGTGTDTAPLPSSFDWYAKNPGCVPPTINQGSCQDCWAIASSRAITFDLCNTFGVPVTRGISIQHIVGCAYTTNGNGCEPQAPSTGFTFMYGDVHDTLCMPLIPTGTSATGCPTHCQGAAGATLSTVNGIMSGSFVKLTGADTIKRYIMQNGAVAVAMAIMSDFLQTFPLDQQAPATTVYNPQTLTTLLGNHMMAMYGWEDNAPVPYWKVHNSWDEINQFIKIAQNIAILQNRSYNIEQFTYAGTARLGSINPPVPVQTTAPGAQTTTVTPTPIVYTTPYGCPNLLLNQNQTVQSASMQTCAANSAASTNSKTAANERNAAFVRKKANGGVSVAASAGIVAAGVAVALLVMSAVA
jgi:hypothetical protein